MAENASVQVALRIRPLVPSEISRGCKTALEVFHDVKQVRISDKSFTFNHVFDSDTNQNDFYRQSVEGLIPNLFKGYNLTILAYGQTGSGKTHSMGTAYNGQGDMGIIPRAVNDIFTFIKDNFAYDFAVNVSFVELYQEVLYDLLSTKSREQCVVDIREDVNKGIFMPGLTEMPVTTATETLECLQQGSKGRATSRTNMNEQSSRSHAIFTVSISMTQKGTAECKTAKFHLVDLAGSERPKKTGATGQTFREGININKGLFVLGNVISALGDEKGQPGYVNYRESNLTRLLKDSLGGNSITMMVACVSPADYNLEETLSTLRYADRAKRIKNKPVINEDPKAAEISKLNKIIQQLKLELLAHGGGSGPLISYEENNTLKKEVTDLKNKLHVTLSYNSALHERVLLMQTANESMAQKFHGLQDEYSTTITNLNVSLEANDVDAIKNYMNTLQTIQSHFTDIDNDQKKNEAEITSHELLVARNSDTTNCISEEEIDVQQENYTTKQIAMNAQIQEVTKMLAQKEGLAKQIATNACYMVDLTEMADNQSKIAELEKEKGELVQQLKQAHHQGPSNKISEQRRKRVQELEQKLTDLNRKVQEQARLIKMKEKDEIKIKRLNVEITSMKSEKVKLIKGMRQESEHFRKWKMEREREMSKLQNRDRKRQNEIANMQRQHTLQQNVLRRKLEEAASNSKRLKDALALRKNIQDSKVKGQVERFGPWIQQELNIFVTMIRAKASCEMLCEHRASIQQQIDKLANNKEENLEELQKLQEDADLRTAQIQELQQKIVEGDDEDKHRTRFDNLQTMAEAKYAIKVLFDLTTDSHRNVMESERKIEEFQAAQLEFQKLILEQEAKLVALESQHDDVINEIEKDYEEKTMLLLKQLRGVEPQGIDIQTQHRMVAQEEMIKKLEEVVTSLQAEKEELIANVSSVATDAPKPSTPPKRKKKSDTNKENVQRVHLSEHLDDSINVSMEDDPSNDPDWRSTPLAKQVRAMRDTRSKQPAKRNVSGGCYCKGNCGGRQCSCRKNEKGCCNGCRCKITNCVNRLPDDLRENNEDVPIPEEDNNDVSTFKKPRLTGDRLQTVTQDTLPVPKRIF